MAAKSFYSVVLFSAETQTWEWSRAFTRKANALKWAKWLATFAASKVYEGQPGGVLLAEFATTA